MKIIIRTKQELTVVMVRPPSQILYNDDEKLELADRLAAAAHVLYNEAGNGNRE